MSLADLKKKRGNMTDRLREKADQEEKSGGGNYKDDRFWYPQRDDNGNASCLIRFLPEPPDEEMPYVYYWHHGFKGPTGQWYIENSRSTIGESDFILDANNALWNSGVDEYKELARARKRKLTYVSNIIVLKDPKNPENEGKVLLMKYGKKIHDMVKSCLRPEFDDEEPFNPFDFWEGANFKFKVRKVDGQTNYDKSEFESPSELFNGDESKLEEVYEQLYSLQQFVSAENYKDYDKLKERFEKVVGPNDPCWKLMGVTPSNATDAQRQDRVVQHEAEQQERRQAPADDSAAQMNVSDKDDDLDNLQQLTEDDDDLPFADL